VVLTWSGLGKKHHLNQNKGKRKRSRRRGGERRRREEQEPLSPPLETVTLLLGAAVREQRHHHRPPPQCRQRSSPTSRAPPPPHQLHFASPFISFGCLRFLPTCRTFVLHARGWGENNSPLVSFPTLGQAGSGLALMGSFHWARLVLAQF